jgi:hypothetical protein
MRIALKLLRFSVYVSSLQSRSLTLDLVLVFAAIRNAMLCNPSLSFIQPLSIFHPPSLTCLHSMTLVLLCSLLTGLELVKVPAADVHVALVLGHAVGVLLDVHRAGAGRLIGSGAVVES